MRGYGHTMLNSVQIIPFLSMTYQEMSHLTLLSSPNLLLAMRQKWSAAMLHGFFI